MPSTTAPVMRLRMKSFGPGESLVDRALQGEPKAVAVEVVPFHAISPRAVHVDARREIVPQRVSDDQVRFASRTAIPTPFRTETLSEIAMS